MVLESQILKLMLEHLNQTLKRAIVSRMNLPLFHGPTVHFFSLNRGGAQLYSKKIKMIAQGDILAVLRQVLLCECSHPSSKGQELHLLRDRVPVQFNSSSSL